MWMEKRKGKKESRKANGKRSCHELLSTKRRKNCHSSVKPSIACAAAGYGRITDISMSSSSSSSTSLPATRTMQARHVCGNRLRYLRSNDSMFQRLKSGKERVVLKHLNLDSQGTYKCEVSGEGPSFRTKSDSDHMVVVVPPQRAEIVDAKPKYKVGDTVNVTCISYRSKPAASLNWKINGEDVSQFYGDLVSRSNYNNYEIETRIRQGERGVLETYKGMRSRRPQVRTYNLTCAVHSKAYCFISQLRAELHEYQPVIERGKGRNSMETSRLGLSFVVPPSFYPAGLTLECSASIGSVYWQSFQEKIPISPKDQAVSDPWWSRSSDSAKSRKISSLIRSIFNQTDLAMVFYCRNRGFFVDRRRFFLRIFGVEAKIEKNNNSISKFEGEKRVTRTGSEAGSEDKPRPTI